MEQSTESTLVEKFGFQQRGDFHDDHQVYPETLKLPLTKCTTRTGEEISGVVLDKGLKPELEVYVVVVGVVVCWLWLWLWLCG